jgi:hypothetical protein
MPNSLMPVMKDPVPLIVEGLTTNTTQDPTVVVDKPLATTADCYRPSKPTNMEPSLAVGMGKNSSMSNFLTPVMKDPVPSIHHGATLHTPPDPTVAVDKQFGTIANYYRPSNPTIMEPSLAVVMGENSKLSNSLTPVMKDPIPSIHLGATLHTPPHPTVYL